MPSRRRQMAMSDDEIHDFLREQQKIVLVSNGKNGFPHPIHMLYHCDEEGILWMTSYAKAMKVKNLERDPRITKPAANATRTTAPSASTRRVDPRDGDVTTDSPTRLFRPGSPRPPRTGSAVPPRPARVP